MKGHAEVTYQLMFFNDVTETRRVFTREAAIAGRRLKIKGGILLTFYLFTEMESKSVLEKQSGSD